MLSPARLPRILWSLCTFRRQASHLESVINRQWTHQPNLRISRSRNGRFPCSHLQKEAGLTALSVEIMLNVLINVNCFTFVSTNFRQTAKKRPFRQYVNSSFQQDVNLLLETFLCPRIEWSEAYCFCPVCLFVCLFVCLLSTLTFAITFEP